MKFGMENYKILLICRYKVIEIDYIKMQDEDCIKHEEHDRTKYLGVIEGGRIKTAVMKEKIEKEYFCRVRKLSNSVLYEIYCNRNHSVGTWSC